MPDPWEERLRAADRIAKLLALHEGSSGAESVRALEKAQELADKHGIQLQDIKPDAPLSKNSKLAQARKNAASFGVVFSKQYTGQDTEDYTKYEQERKQRAEERKRRDADFSWDKDEY